MNPGEDFRRYMKAISQPPDGSSGNHPGMEQLAAYMKESLGSADQDVIQRHVADCARCAETLSDLRDFFEGPRQEETELSAFEVAHAWKSLNRRLPSGQSSSSRAMLRSSLALAASVVVSVGLGVSMISIERQKGELQGLLSTRESRLRELEEENQRLQESGARFEAEISQLRSPQPNALLFDLFSRAWVERSGGESAIAEITVPREARSYVLILSGEGQRRPGEYSLEITDEEGKSLWRGEGLRQDVQGNFVITLERAFLNDGQYLLVLYGKRGDQPVRLAEYPVRVKSQ